LTLRVNRAPYLAKKVSAILFIASYAIILRARGIFVH
jgi:hypothetical protein